MGDGGKGSGRRPGVMPEGAWERIGWGKGTHRPKQDQVVVEDAEPDVNCVTTADGGCESTLPCMHTARLDELGDKCQSCNNYFCTCSVGNTD